MAKPNTLMGYRLHGPFEISISDLRGRHPMNALIDRKLDASLVREIREEGQKEPAIIDHAMRIIGGGRRVEALQRNKVKTVAVYQIKEKLSDEEVMKMVCKDFIRSNPQDADNQALIEAFLVETGRIDKIMQNAPRGSSGKSSNKGRLYREIHDVFRHLSYDTIENIISVIRRKHKNARVRRKLVEWEPNGHQANYIRNRARRIDEITDEMQSLKEERRRLEGEVAGAIPSSIGLVGKAAKIAAARKAVDRRDKQMEADEAGG